MFEPFVHQPLYDLLIKLGADECDAGVAATLYLDTNCIQNMQTIFRKYNNHTDDDEPDSSSGLDTDQKKIDFLVSEVQELRELLAPVVALLEDGNKLDEWNTNVISAMEMLESTTELMNAMNVRILKASSEKLKGGF